MSNPLQLPLDEELTIETHPAYADVHDRMKVQFPFDAVYSKLDGDDSGETPIDKQVDAARDAMLWIADSLKEAKRPIRSKLAGTRAVAILWVLWPSLLPSADLRTLSRLMGISYKRLSVYTSEASKLLGHRNPSQVLSVGYKCHQTLSPTAAAITDR